MNWVTRQGKRIDRIACPWLIRRFIDPAAKFEFVTTDQILYLTAKYTATSFDVPGGKYEHVEDDCTFDDFIRKHEALQTPQLQRMAAVIRAAEFEDYTIAPEAKGIVAVLSGMIHNFPDPQELIDKSMVIMDALYAWAGNIPPEGQSHRMEHSGTILLDLFHAFITQKYAERRTKPLWIKEIGGMIQDVIDNKFTLGLKEFGKLKDIQTESITREFERYFREGSFGEQMMKLRAAKAAELLAEDKLTLSEVSYLCGFSDYNHFSRIYTKYTGTPPAAMQKTIRARIARERKAGGAGQENG